ncbi:MAG: sensor histidine kinase, partial [Gammaproteobacteria bacterium]
VVLLYITRPVDAIRLAIERVKRGRPVLEAELARVGKMSRLTRDFNEMLERVHKSFADACHEIRTPLTILRGEAEVALRDPQARVVDYRDALTNIVGGAKNLASLVDDFMFLSRSEVGQIRYEMQQVDVCHLLDEVVRQCGAHASIQQVELDFKKPDASRTPFSVLGDPSRLRQLFVILVDNAIKYTEAGGRVDVGAKNEGASIQVDVSDTGVGISSNDLPLVCDRFYRGAASRAKKVDGCGLGLSIAKSIVQVHLGALQFDSDPGRGTTALVTLPGLVHKQAP